MKITNPELKVVRFANEDVIATSGILPTNGQFFIPINQFTGSYSGTGDYVRFDGSFVNNGSGSYQISNISRAEGYSAEDREGLHIVNGKFYLPEMGFWMTANEGFINISKQSYDAFSYGDGNYYTNGVSYYENWPQ